MIISDLNYMESAEANIQGGTGYDFYESDKVVIAFDTTNTFTTKVNSPTTYSNSAAAGAKGVANTNGAKVFSFTKADTLAVADYLGSSFSASTSVAVINAAYKKY